ncbi:hypothetical protein TNCV_1035561 [Trichonephila clavipes]|nr:hypothetical protein TNCV_1035561 [Trichonephila clavipes]
MSEPCLHTVAHGIEDRVKNDDAKVGRRTMLLARWTVRIVPLEIVEGSGQEKVPGLERPGRPRGERIEGSCGKHLWTPH